MTNFDKVRGYYRVFDEKNRLQNDNSGKLEFYMTMKILKDYLPTSGTILDLGGGAGAYSFPLVDEGYNVYLSDLSEDLINQAKIQNEERSNAKLSSCDVVNAINLDIYQDNQFDAVLLFGPLYHLLEESERRQCLTEINRVLKPGGMVFASFIPYLSGSIAIIDRYFRHPEQVNLSNLSEVFKTGKFNNSSDKGFQEGYYPSINEIETLFSNNGFEKDIIRSIRSFGYEKEDSLYSIRDKEIFDEVIELMDKHSADPSIVDMCGHAMYVGRKKQDC